MKGGLRQGGRDPRIVDGIRGTNEDERGTGVEEVPDRREGWMAEGMVRGVVACREDNAIGFEHVEGMSQSFERGVGVEKRGHGGEEAVSVGFVVADLGIGVVASAGKLLGFLQTGLDLRARSGARENGSRDAGFFAGFVGGIDGPR